ncbi:MAG: 4Fe-4S binding protein [Bacteroidaceae bacterium]|nr:4Fe-4S binding protein [Bacteroidaceae bacterium]
MDEMKKTPHVRRRPRFRAENERKRCVACGVCVKACPRGAVSVWRGCYAVVNDEKCIGCGLCVKACPAGVMHKVENE